MGHVPILYYGNMQLAQRIPGQTGWLALLATVLRRLSALLATNRLAYAGGAIKAGLAVGVAICIHTPLMVET